jgi:DNA-binding winged helix-turn-helix (wHTH) protein
MRYCFGDYTLDPTWLRLTRCDQIVEVSRRGFACLHYLIAQRDRVISRDELIRKVWGRDTISDNQLAQVVVAVRHAVGDDGRAQRYIRTVQGVGYHWAGVVFEIPGAAEHAFMPVPHAATEALIEISMPAVETCIAATIQAPKFQKSATETCLVDTFCTGKTSASTLTEEILLRRMTPNSTAADIRITPRWYALGLIALLAICLIGWQLPSMASVSEMSQATLSQATLVETSGAIFPQLRTRQSAELTPAQITRGRELLAAGNAQDLQTSRNVVVARR